jgi:CheY-like chemotaxis protein
VPEVAQVLVIDDDRQVRRLFAHILRDGGIPVVVADTGKKALQLLSAYAFKVVVLDMNMPSPDGFEVLKAIRSDVRRPRVLAVSGFMKGELLGAAGFLGADTTLNKIDAPELLLETVKKLMA